MLGGILAFGDHLRIQLERLEMDLRRNFALELRQRLLQRSEPDRAPRAGDIGDKVDTDGSGRSHEASAKVEDKAEVGVAWAGSRR